MTLLPRPRARRPTDFAGDRINVFVYAITEDRFCASIEQASPKDNPWNDPSRSAGTVRSIDDLGCVLDLHPSGAWGVVDVDAIVWKIGLNPRQHEPSTTDRSRPRISPMLLTDFLLLAPEREPLDRRQFSFETRCVTALFERFFVPFASAAFRVCVHCVEEVRHEEPLLSGGCFDVDHLFSFEEYSHRSPRQKLERALEAVYLGALTVAQHGRWPRERFDVAHDRVIEANFVNQWRWPKRPRWRRDRKYQAFLACSHEPATFRAKLCIAGKDGTLVKEMRAFECDPHEFAFGPRFGTLAWSERGVILADRNREEVACLSI